MLAIALVAIILIWTRESVRPEYAVRFQVPVPENVSLGSADLPVLSPDGRRLAFAGSTPDGIRHLWIHSFDSPNTQIILARRAAFHLFGRRIAGS
jgi:hypothetical protein